MGQLVFYSQLVLVILKCAGVIAWPWIWVVSPLWGGFLLNCILLYLLDRFL